MRWKVTGANATTGDDVKITVEAPDAGEAERPANYNGILVTAISLEKPAAAGPMVPYETPASLAPRAALPIEKPPQSLRLRGVVRSTPSTPISPSP